MTSNRFKKIEGALEDFDDSWEEEIERLKHEIKRAEKRIFKSEQKRLPGNVQLIKGFDAQDNESLRSTIPVDLSSPPLEGLIRGRKLSARSAVTHPSPRSYKKLGDVPMDKISKESVAEIWTSPSVAKPRQIKRDVFPEQFANCLESSFDIDCGSSIVSLDFGLVSPNKTWCSPPQRIERAQNREWSSPHRVIDRPNPENSPGNWISMKESCATPKHSPTLGVKKETVKEPSFSYPEPESRPVSQSTYVVQEAGPLVEAHSKDNQPTRKISVLENYEPERIITTNKRSGDPSEPIERNLLPTNEKMRKVVIPSGHVVKVSLLDDFEAPVFGRTHEKTLETTEGKETFDRTVKSTAKTAAASAKSSPSLRFQAKKKQKGPKGEGAMNAGQAVHGAGMNEDEENKTKESKNVDIGKTVHKMIHNFEQMFGSTNEDADKTAPASEKEKGRTRKSKPKKTKSETERVEEKPLEPPEKRKRNVDPKVVREYIKSQKQKRIEQVKMEKKTKDAEKETRKKNLEELRIKTLKIATQAKKKKSPRCCVKEVKAATTEDDVTMSLGLKQETPRVSYNESISKLKKKMVHQKPQTALPEPQPGEDIPEASGGEEDAGNNPQEIIVPEVAEDLDLKKPEESPSQKASSDLNVTLKKLAESLHLKIDQRAKEIRSKTTPPPLKSAKNPPPQETSHDTPRSAKSLPEENRQMVSVDVETIKTLKSDIKKISENFKALHEIIAEKGDLSGRGSLKQWPSPGISQPPKPHFEDVSKEIPVWLKNFMPKPYPFNVFSAFQKKMNLKTTKELSSVSQGSCTFAEHSSNKCDSEFEGLSVPSDRLRSVKEIARSFKSTSCGTYEDNYFSLKDDSGSELSSSILDSDKQSTALSKRPFSKSSSKVTSGSLSSSIITEITSRSIQKSKVFSLTYSKSSCSRVYSKSSCSKVGSKSSCSRVDSKSSFGKADSGKENLILITPDIQLISNDPNQEKLNNCTKNLNLYQTPCEHIPEELNGSEKSSKAKTDSPVREAMDNPSVSPNGKSRRSREQGEEKGHVRKSFFQPEILRLQFQAELNLIEKFQQSLTHFLETERAKSLAETNKIVYEKAINTERVVDKEDRSTQAAHLESSGKTTPEESYSVETEINAVESIKTDRPDSLIKEQDLVSEVTEKLSSSSKETLKDDKPQDLDNSDVSSERLSLQTLNNTMKDEELRSEHLLALISLREKTLTEKVKAELTFLEMKKRALKGMGSDEEQNISAIKKKQRGILLKYQSQKEDIERLKKMHRVTSNERKTVMKRQKQIQQMQISDNGTIRLKKREKSPQKKAPLKPKALNFESQSEIPESFLVVSDSLLSECSPDESKHSSRSDPDFSPRSNVRNIENRKLNRSTTFFDLENFKSRKSQLEVERYPWKQCSVEDLVKWSKRLEEKENHLKELEKQAVSTAVRAKNRLMKSLKNAKTSTKDRSTSPFQFQDSVKTMSEVSAPEVVEAKKSTTISEEIETNPKTGATEMTESVAEKLQSSASEDLPEHCFKKNLTSRTSEYQSESFESPSSSETPKIKPEMTQRSEWGHKSIAIKLSLSPRLRSPRRRCSSGSDDSVNLSHTETASEHSDLESRIAALHEQLLKRKLEAERLRREQKKAQRERLKVKEQCLLNQIQAYDAYIQKKKQELEREYEHSNQTVMKPVIKQPGVSEKRRGDLMIVKRNDTEKSEAKTTEKEESSYTEKIPDKESDSEVTEQIKAASESIGKIIDESNSIREQIESKLEEEEKSKTERVGPEQSLKESFDEGKSTSVSESLPEQEKSQPESEDQSISVKTLQSPERQDTDVVEALTFPEDGNQDTQTMEDYHFDSFESDPDEKTNDVIQKTSEANKGTKETDSDSTGVNENSESTNSVSREKEEDLEWKEKSEKAEKIADSIMVGLILESLNAFRNKKAEAEKKLAEESRLSLEILSNFLAKEIISEAIEDIIKMYNRRACPEEERDPERISSEVRERITESLMQTEAPRDRKRPLDVITATYDVSPSDEAASEGPERERFLQSPSPLKNEKPEKQARDEEESYIHEPKMGTCGQDWTDDDFELSQTRREAEELRLQQLQIEQEIQQLQAQQKQVPYFYLREIPNKPPPPYTPPAKPITEIPASESDLMRITFNAVRILTDEMSKGLPIADIAPDWEYYGEVVSENYKCYKLFLFDLAKHIISDLLAQQERKVDVLPWMRTRKRLSKYKYQKIERTFEGLYDFVQRQIFFLFGFGRNVSKESLIVRWIKKKRDHVDEILVGESQKEEAQWTQYDEDQITVKNEVALSILDGLLEDTAQLLNAIFNNKLDKEKRNLAVLQSEKCFK